MEHIEKVLEKLKEARKEKGYSHENMAAELGISQAAYTNIEKKQSNLTVERLIKIAEILEKPTFYFFEANPNNVFNQTIAENAIGNQAKEIYQENKEVYHKLSDSYETTIQNLKDEVSFLRKLVEGRK